MKLLCDEPRLRIHAGPRVDLLAAFGDRGARLAHDRLLQHTDLGDRRHGPLLEALRQSNQMQSRYLLGTSYRLIRR